MTAYSENELFNYHVISEAHIAHDTAEISKESLNKIEQAYPYKLYTPHFFVAIALGLLTFISVIFTGFLFWLVTGTDSSGFAILCAFMAALCYFFLEWFVRRKNYFNAGVDNALMVLILGFSAGAFLSNFENSWFFFNGVMMLIALWLCLRFIDAFMAVVSCSFFLIFSFLLILKLWNGALPYFPFLMMLIIGLLYFWIKKAKNQIKFMHEKCITALTVFLLLTFYAAGNYWVLIELRSSIPGAPDSVPFGWLFWILTFIIPLVYMVCGVIKKDLLTVRSGFILAVATILTYKYYYTLLPVEVEMLFGGLLLLGLSFILIKWLRPSRHGYTSEISSSRRDWQNIETLIIAETTVDSTLISKDNLMAGGSGGGGGASGEF